MDGLKKKIVVTINGVVQEKEYTLGGYFRDISGFTKANDDEGVYTGVGIAMTSHSGYGLRLIDTNVGSTATGDEHTNQQIKTDFPTRGVLFVSQRYPTISEDDSSGEIRLYLTGVQSSYSVSKDIDVYILGTIKSVDNDPKLFEKNDRIEVLDSSNKRIGRIVISEFGYSLKDYIRGLNTNTVSVVDEDGKKYQFEKVSAPQLEWKILYNGVLREYKMIRRLIKTIPCENINIGDLVDEFFISNVEVGKKVTLTFEDDSQIELDLGHPVDIGIPTTIEKLRDGDYIIFKHEDKTIKGHTNIQDGSEMDSYIKNYQIMKDRTRGSKYDLYT